MPPINTIHTRQFCPLTCHKNNASRRFLNKRPHRYRRLFQEQPDTVSPQRPAERLLYFRRLPSRHPSCGRCAGRSGMEQVGFARCGLRSPHTTICHWKKDICPEKLCRRSSDLSANPRPAPRTLLPSVGVQSVGGVHRASKWPCHKLGCKVTGP